jgi:hypothetical protein
VGAVHILAPALWIPPEGFSDVAVPRAPVLARILGRARHQSVAPAESFNTRLFALFGIHAAADADLPVAAATHWTDFAADHSGSWMRIDPVHLRPDLGKLLLFDANHFSITPAEAISFLSELNPHLRDYDMEIICGTEPTRWYLRMAQPPRLQTTPPHWLNGRHVDPWLARGTDAPFWQRLLTEMQMILHLSVTNGVREESRAPPINSLWPWGLGPLPPDRRSSVEIVVSDDPVAIGLAYSANISLIPFDELLARNTLDGDVVLVLSSGANALYAGDASAWRRAVEALDQDYLSALFGALSRWRSSSLHVHLPDGWWTLDPSRRWQFWRRARLPDFRAQFPFRP